MTSPLTSLKPGDIITAYVKGVHEVISIKRRYIDETTIKWTCNEGKKIGDEKSPLVRYRRKLNSNGNKAPNKEELCDAVYCHKITQEVIDEQYAEAVKIAQKRKEATEQLIAGKLK